MSTRRSDTGASYLLDTNVISETRKKRPDAKVQDWLSRQPLYTQYLSVITLGELLQGAKRARNSTQREDLLAWLERLEQRFDRRVLPIDAAVMRTWSDVTALAIQSGQTTPLLDSLIAATALTHHLTLVTRNTDDVQALGVKVLNPWLT